MRTHRTVDEAPPAVDENGETTDKQKKRHRKDRDKSKDKREKKKVRIPSGLSHFVTTNAFSSLSPNRESTNIRSASTSKQRRFLSLRKLHDVLVFLSLVIRYLSLVARFRHVQSTVLLLSSGRKRNGARSISVRSQVYSSRRKTLHQIIIRWGTTVNTTTLTRQQLKKRFVRHFFGNLHAN